jgi:hypothetical protein
MNDTLIPLSLRGRAWFIDGWLAYDLSEGCPRAYIDLIEQRALAKMFTPLWGFLFDEGEDDAYDDN